MNKANPHFERFVRDFANGNRQEAAQKLGVSIALVGHLMNGRRQVSIPVAQTIGALTRGEISRHDLRPDVYGPAPERSAA